MAGKKPLIFVYPLSESLQKLKDIMSESSEENGLEIYEVDAAVEAVQLIPTVGQSLTLFSNPKKCAQILQASKKFMSKINSKAILLSPKQMPRKTLDKFSKVGLTECIVEPVAPKTLLYKVNLIMRSIVAQKDEEDEEFEVKSLSSGEIEEAEGNEKQRMEKGVLEDDVGEDLYAREKKEKQLEIEAEEEEKKKKSNYSEEAIDTDWKGSVEQEGLDLESDDEDKKNKYEEEDIDTYYKGETQSAELDLGEDEATKKEKAEFESEEAGWGDKEDKSKSLDLDEEDEENNKENHDEIDSYMRGKVGKADTELEMDDEDETSLEKEKVDDEKYLKGKINQDLMVEEEDELEGVIREDEEEQDYDEEETKKTHLELDDDEDKDIEKEEHELEEAEDYKKEREDFDLEDAEDHKKERHDLEEEEQTENQKEEAEEIEKYYKGKIGEQEEEEESEDYTEDDSKKTDLDLEEAENYKKDKEDYDLEEDSSDYEKEKKDDTELDFDEDMYDREKLEDEEMEDYSKKKNSELDLEDADDNKDYEKEDDEDDLDGDDKDKKDSLDLDLEDDSDRDKAMGREDDERGEFGRRESSKDLDLEDGGFQKKAKMVEKDVGGHYSNKKSVQHQEYDWENLNNKFNQNPDEEEKQKKDENTLTYEGKDDLGEQTIDYSKLWEEFGGITMDREASKAKVTGPKYVAGEKVEDAKTASHYSDDEEGENPNFDGAKGSQDEEEIKPIHEPKPNGLDTAVKILNFYQQKDTRPEDVYKYIANIIHDEEGGITSFLTMNKDKHIYEDAYISILEMESGLDETEKKAIWTEQKVKNQSRWRELTLPTWSDETFQNKELEFFYPFYEGVSDLGLAVIDFKNGISQEKVKKLEIILETARGLFLEEFHDTGSKGTYDGHEAEEQKKGFFKKTIGKLFGGLFGKKKDK